MSRPIVPAALSALILAAAAAPGGVSRPGDGYCADSGCPYYGLEVALHVLVDNAVMPDREAEGSCRPVEFTGGQPDLVVYPILNMVVIHNCIIKDGLLVDGPIVGTVRNDGRYETPAHVTLTRSDSSEEDPAGRVLCASLGTSSTAPRIQVYSAMDMYNLDACSIDWSTFHTGTLHAYLTISPVGA